MIKQKLSSAWIWLKKQWKGALAVLGVVGIAYAMNGGIESVNEISAEKIYQKYGQSAEISSKYQIDGTELILPAKNINSVKVKVGDKSKTNFEPDITLSRWDEVSFKVMPNLSEVAVKDRTLTFENNKIKYGTPKIDYVLYDLPVSSENIEGGYEFEVILKEKPTSNKIEFVIESQGLDFEYQPELQDEEAQHVADLFGISLLEAKRKMRPERVLNSYEVFYTGHPLNIKGGKIYGTGKAFSIYRPEIIDAEGNKIWGEIRIENVVMTITIPQEFLDTAIYPVIVDPTFGNSTPGGSNDWLANDRIYANGDTYTGAVGTGNSMSFYGTGNGLTIQTGVYNVNALVGNTGNIALTSSAGWRTGNFVSEPTLSAIEYTLGFNCSADNVVAYWSTTGTNNYKLQAAISYGTWPDPAEFETQASIRQYSLYVTYTAGGGATPAPIIVPQQIIFIE